MTALQQSNGTTITHFVHRDGYAEPVREGFSWSYLLAGPFWFLHRRMAMAAFVAAAAIVFAWLIGSDLGALLVLVASAATANRIHHALLLRRGYQPIMPDGWTLADLSREPLGFATPVTYLLLLAGVTWYTYYAVSKATLEAQQMLQAAGIN